MNDNIIAVLGATGGAGCNVSRWLAQAGFALRLGGRRRDPLQQLATRLDAEARPVDLWQEDELREFCRGCVAVVNCAGPSYQVLDRVARAAASAQAHYVDVSGDGPAWHLLQRQPAGDEHWTAVLSAGMLPGLANLVPGWMSQSTGGELTVYSGGIERVSGAAAADLVLSLNEQCNALQGSDYWYGEAGAGWRLGRRARHVLSTQQTDTLAHFAGHVTLLPWLSADAERLAQRHHLSALSWYNVFSGQCLRETLTGLRGKLDGTSQSLSIARAAVEKASEIDLAGYAPYYQMVFDWQKEGEWRRRVVVRTDSSLALTAATAVSTVLSLMRGEIAPGVHFADRVLNPATVLADITRLHAGTHISQYLPDMQPEQGVI
ncbi:hypothetical protein VW41_14175 [Klebsiella michiganensis]|nr:hypothetical protein VW41_14175 [Klebsiella michiganensis]